MKSFKKVFRSHKEKSAVPSAATPAQSTVARPPQPSHRADAPKPPVVSVPEITAPPEAEVEMQFNLRVDKTMWPAFDLSSDTETAIKAAGPYSVFSSDTLAMRWARGASVGNSMGSRLFPARTGASQRPPMLFDLELNRTVPTASLGFVNYAFISHVWGRTIQLDGGRYGVQWKLPVKNADKLTQMLDAARVVLGERYIWLDILCMDQSRRNESEISNMKVYLSNATGCFVWLDNAYDEPGWDKVLASIKKLNSFFDVDQHGKASTAAVNSLLQGGNALDLSLNEKEALTWVRHLVQLNNAPWFKRVWTLQEGVVPTDVQFCTPERFMTSGSIIWHIAALCEVFGAVVLQDGALMGTAIATELQRSEVYKVLKLRQLHQDRQLTFWHLVQAVRTRDCQYEQDRVLGTLALHSHRLPTVSYNQSLESLYAQVFRAHIEAGDMTALHFVGQPGLLPSVPNCMGYVQVPEPGAEETHSLHLTQQELSMSGVGTDSITRVFYVTSQNPAMREAVTKSGTILNLPAREHKDVAVAFGLEPLLYNNTELCPASIAAIGALNANRAAVFSNFDQTFQDMIEDCVPKAMLQWLKVSYLMQDRNDAAVAIIWTRSGPPQLAVVTEELRGSVLAVMPSSYKHSAGPGSLLMAEQADGRYKKVGLGLGPENKALNLEVLVLAA